MFPPFNLGRLFGIPLQARISFLLMLAAVLLFLGGLSGVFVVLLAFASIVLHELGHALVARRLGVGVSAIELHFFGGVARLESQPKSSNDELAIAAAGPAVSLVLSGVALLFAAASGWYLFELLATINLVIALFNLIPALPMDGGRILRAFLAPRMGFLRATNTAVKISRAVSIAFVVFGLAFAQIQLLLLAAVLWYMASSELRMARYEQQYGTFRRSSFSQESFAQEPSPFVQERSPFVGFGSRRGSSPSGYTGSARRSESGEDLAKRMAGQRKVVIVRYE